MKIVLDCNVLISASVNDGTCRQVFRKAIEGHQLFFSQQIADEYLETITKLKFKKETAEEFYKLVSTLFANANVIEPLPCNVQLLDKDDEIYLAVALTAKADVLITGDKKHVTITKG
ncbi:MAG: putative toxin-antitoxin system toxin component, PIN family [Nitrospirota bacterium]